VEERVQLKAVIFDYGMVLSGPPNDAMRAELVKRIGKDPVEAEAIYVKYRKDYDFGFLTGLEYWAKIFADAGLEPNAESIAAMAELDAKMWTGTNQPMLAWARVLRQKGLKTAILSNMGDRVLANMKKELTWIEEFEVQVWSYQLKTGKPEAPIYRHALAALGVEPGEALFVDDILANVEGARAVGLLAAQYLSTGQLKKDLQQMGLESTIPLPW